MIGKQIYSNRNSLIFYLVLFASFIYFFSKINLYFVPNSDFFLYLSEGGQFLKKPFSYVLSAPLYSVIVYLFEIFLPLKNSGVTGGIVFNILCLSGSIVIIWKMTKKAYGLFSLIPICLFLINPLTLSVVVQPVNSALFFLLALLAIYVFDRKPAFSYLIATLSFFTRYEGIILFPILIIYSCLIGKKITKPKSLIVALVIIGLWISISYNSNNQYFWEITARKNEIPNFTFLSNALTYIPFKLKEAYLLMEPIKLSYQIKAKIILMITWLGYGGYLTLKRGYTALFILFLFLTGYAASHILFVDSSPRYNYPALLPFYIFFTWPFTVYSGSSFFKKTIIISLGIFTSVLISYNLLNSNGFINNDKDIKAEKRILADWLNKNIVKPTKIYAFEFFITDYFTDNKNVKYATQLDLNSLKKDVCNKSDTDTIVAVDNQSLENNQYFDYINGVGFFEDFKDTEIYSCSELLDTLKYNRRWVELYKLNTCKTVLCTP